MSQTLTGAQSDGERTIRRLEAFSDIVIGFSLAQLGASLAFTKTMTLDAGGIASFAFSFAIICSLWFFHHRLFAQHFAPRTLPIILNFAWLADVVVLVFVSKEVARHFTPGVTQPYFALFAIAYGILAVQTVIGARAKHLEEPEFRRRASISVIQMSYWAAVFLICFALVTFIAPSGTLGASIDATFVIAIAGSSAVSVAARRRYETVAPDR